MSDNCKIMNESIKTSPLIKECNLKYLAYPQDLSEVPTTTSESETLNTLNSFEYAPRWLLAAAAVIMLISATFDTTATKFMNKQKLPTCLGCDATFFQAPLFQTWTGYVGQLILLPFYFWDQWISKKKEKKPLLDFTVSQAETEKPLCPKWFWILPLLLDFSATTCLNYATMLVQASSVQMLRSFNIILTFILSAFVLKNRLYIHQITGVTLVLVGSLLIGLYSVINPDTETNFENFQWIGIIAALLGTSFSALQWVLEESIFRRYYCSPFEGAGLMGLFGVILSTVVLIFAQFLGLENLDGAFYQMSLNRKESHLLIALNILYVFSLAINTTSGITVTKLSSSLLRTIVNAGRTWSIWIIEMLLGWSKFQSLNFSGLICIFLAIMIYNYNYINSQYTRWFGDTILRAPVSCLPNKFDVPNYDSNLLKMPLQQDVSELKKIDRRLEYRRISTKVSTDQALKENI